MNCTRHKLCWRLHCMGPPQTRYWRKCDNHRSACRMLLCRRGTPTGWLSMCHKSSSHDRSSTLVQYPQTDCQRIACSQYTCGLTKVWGLCFRTACLHRWSGPHTHDRYTGPADGEQTVSCYRRWSSYSIVGSEQEWHSDTGTPERYKHRERCCTRDHCWGQVQWFRRSCLRRSRVQLGILGRCKYQAQRIQTGRQCRL